MISGCATDVIYYVLIPNPLTWLVWYTYITGHFQFDSTLTNSIACSPPRLSFCHVGAAAAGRRQPVRSGARRRQEGRRPRRPPLHGYFSLPPFVISFFLWSALGLRWMKFCIDFWSCYLWRSIWSLFTWSWDENFWLKLLQLLGCTYFLFCVFFFLQKVQQDLLKLDVQTKSDRTPVTVADYGTCWYDFTIFFVCSIIIYEWFFKISNFIS